MGKDVKKMHEAWELWDHGSADDRIEFLSEPKQSRGSSAVCPHVESLSESMGGRLPVGVCSVAAETSNVRPGADRSRGAKATRALANVEINAENGRRRDPCSISLTAEKVMINRTSVACTFLALCLLFCGGRLGAGAQTEGSWMQKGTRGGSTRCFMKFIRGVLRTATMMGSAT